jgi:hypothetical protein
VELSSRRERSVARIFDFIDIKGVEGRTAEVALRLNSGGYLTVLGGGVGVLASPAAGPFTDYEVLMDHDPPRFWHRYEDDEELGSRYAHVPALLIAHHIIRNGMGIEDMSPQVSRREVTATLSVRLTCPPAMTAVVMSTLSALSGVNVLATHASVPQHLHLG